MKPNCDELPGHLAAICRGTHRKSDGRPYTLADRRKIIARRLRVSEDEIELDDIPAKVPPAIFSGIGDRLHKIIKRETGAEIPCSECRDEITRLNRRPMGEVLAERDALAQRIVTRAKTKAPKWWQRWGVSLAPGLAKSRVLSWIDEACEEPEAPLPVATGPASDVTIVVKSFRRHRALWRFVMSVRRWYPDVPIVICDDSFANPNAWTDALKDVAATPGVTLVRLPYDSGIARGRNAAVQAATTSRIVLCDDDFVFTHETRIENLLTILDAGYDIVGGVVRMNGTGPENWTGRLSFSGIRPNRTVHLSPLKNGPKRVSGLHCQETDITLNFFAARRDALLATPWDSRYQITEEHLDSFLEWKEAGLAIAWTKSCVIGHWQEAPPGYRQLRNRKDGFSRLNRKWGVAKRDLVKRHPVPGLPMKETRKMFADEVKLFSNVPIVVLGVGRCGTSIAAKMLMRLGWKCPLADEEFAEHTEMRSINERAIQSRIWDDPRARQLVATLAPPWVLKDPRLALTLDQWRPYLADEKPLLLWISRDLDAIRASMQKRGWGDARDGEVYLRGHSIAELHAMCQRHFDAWPWGKLHVSHEQLASAIALFDPNRG